MFRNISRMSYIQFQEHRKNRLRAGLEAVQEHVVVHFQKHIKNSLRACLEAFQDVFKCTVKSSARTYQENI